MNGSKTAYRSPVTNVFRLKETCYQAMPSRQRVQTLKDRPLDIVTPGVLRRKERE